MAKFNAYVYVPDEDGNIVIFEPGQTTPKWAEDKVGKHVFAKSETDEDVVVNGPGMTTVEAKRLEAVNASRVAREAKAQAEAEAAAAKQQPPQTSQRQA